MAITILSHNPLLGNALTALLRQAGLEAMHSSADGEPMKGVRLVDDAGQHPDVILGEEGLRFPLTLTVLWRALQPPVATEEIGLSLHTHLQPITRQLRGSLAQEAVTDKEIALLKTLHTAPEKRMGRDPLLAAVWGYDAEKITTHTLETHLYRLRKKMRDLGCDLTVQVEGGIVILEARDDF